MSRPIVFLSDFGLDDECVGVCHGVLASLSPDARVIDLTQLDRLVVGLADGGGGYLGIGYLEHSVEEGILRLISPVADAPKALRLGSVRLDQEYRARRVDLRNLFGTD